MEGEGDQILGHLVSNGQNASNDESEESGLRGGDSSDIEIDEGFTSKRHDKKGVTNSSGKMSVEVDSDENETAWNFNDLFESAEQDNSINSNAVPERESLARKIRFYPTMGANKV